MRIDVTVYGDKEIVDKIKQLEKLSQEGVVRALKYSLMAVDERARYLSPVDTGRLANSITWVVEKAEYATSTNYVGKIGTNVKYAPYQELGTRPHFPPISAIAKWLKNKGLNIPAFIVARSMARKGMKARPYLIPGIEKSKGRILKYFEDEIKALHK